LLVSLGLAGVARAEAEVSPRPSRAPMQAFAVPPARLPSVAGLSAAQRQSLQELHQKTHLQLTPLQAAIWVRDQELDALWASEAPDRDKIRDKLSEIDMIRARVRDILIDQRLALIALLTPEQRAAFRAQVASAKPPARAPKPPVLGLEDCITTGDCPGETPLVAKPR
jgi:hypothetical protein